MYDVSRRSFLASALDAGSYPLIFGGCRTGKLSVLSDDMAVGFTLRVR